MHMDINETIKFKLIRILIDHITKMSPNIYLKYLPSVRRKHNNKEANGDKRHHNFSSLWLIGIFPTATSNKTNMITQGLLYLQL